MQVIVLKNNDDTVSIITPCESTVESISESLADKEHAIVDAQDIIDLNHGEFVDARVFSDVYPHVEVDLATAKDVWRDKLRKARAPLLEKLDVEFMRALEQSDTAAVKSIKDKKQELRDVTQHKTLNAAQTLDSIKAFWPY